MAEQEIENEIRKGIVETSIRFAKVRAIEAFKESVETNSARTGIQFTPETIGNLHKEAEIVFEVQTEMRNRLREIIQPDSPCKR